MESGPDKKAKPNFLIVGAAKSGTTSLADNLMQHPEIHIPFGKEFRFFVKDIIQNLSDEDPTKSRIIKTSIFSESEYFNLLKTNKKYSGEASVHYLYHHEHTIPKIKDILGDIPIIIVLRNPIDRLVSSYKYLYNLHQKSLKYELDLESERIKKSFDFMWFHKVAGLYYNQVKSYKLNFTKVHVLTFENYVKNPGEEVKRTLDFLGLEESEAIIYRRKNASKIANSKYQYFQKFFFVKWLKILLNEKQRESIRNILKNKNWFYKDSNFKLDAGERIKFSEFYNDDVKLLSELEGLDLSAWKSDFSFLNE